MTARSRNLTDALRFREGVALYAMLSGLDSARARPMRRRISDALGDGILPDVDGIPNVWIETSSRISYRFGEDLDQARRLADDGGRKYAALVQHRSGRPLGDSFVVMSLEDWSALAVSKI
ncbi:hypothetical protein ABXJ56_12450 [Microbacterium chocolatum]|uniref:hypothetical protein n=1 Tax=Microbacterium aurantiacum TaxID=162393 RepID=UPI00338F092E